MKKIIPSLLLSLLVVGWGSLGSAEEIVTQSDGWRTYQSEKYGFEFNYPPNFTLGKYQKLEIDESIKARLQELGQDIERVVDPLKDAAVLVEKDFIGKVSVTELPMGKVATIIVHPHLGTEAEARRMLADQIPSETINIGVHEVMKLPGYPGPYGGSAFYYLLPVSDEMVVDFTGPRNYYRAKGDRPTEYDVIIEKIISTFEVTR